MLRVNHILVAHRRRQAVSPCPLVHRTEVTVLVCQPEARAFEWPRCSSAGQDGGLRPPGPFTSRLNGPFLSSPEANFFQAFDDVLPPFMPYIS